MAWPPNFRLLAEDGTTTMKTNLRWALIFTLLAAFAVAWPWQARVTAGDEVDVIVNKANDTGDLSAADAKKIFMGDKSVWGSGKRVSILMLAPGQSERAVILKEIYKMSEADYGKYFLQAAFAGRVTAPPKDVGSAAQMKQLVAANPGAIGYLKKSDVDDSVKVVLKFP
jgi:ABC-type phosphate transport system substrate-binding protein